MSLIDLEAFRTAIRIDTPFEHCIVPEFIPQAAIPRILADFPEIDEGGSYPLVSLECGPVFQQLCDELRGEAVQAAFAEKFDMDLSQRPTTLTVRGQCRARDGQIHTDSKTKLITVLIYLNESWSAAGGRLRLLRSPDNMDDYLSEVIPALGTLLCFRNRPNAWHGHTSYEGSRRAIQLNWVTNDAAARRSERRHGLSALVKKLNPFRKAA